MLQETRIACHQATFVSGFAECVGANGDCAVISYVVYDYCARSLALSSCTRGGSSWCCSAGGVVGHPRVHDNGSGYVDYTYTQADTLTHAGH